MKIFLAKGFYTLCLIITLSLTTLNAKQNYFLTQNEANFLMQLQYPVKVGITFIPQQVIVSEDETYKGFAIDLFKSIEQASNIDFEYIYFKTWDNVLAAAMNKDIDIVFLAQKTEERLSYLNFTDIIITQENKIITKLGGKKNLTIDNLSNKKIAITKGSAIGDYILYKVPSATLISSQSEEEALSFVSQGMADATVAEIVRTSYNLEKLNITNLSISGHIDYSYNLRIASRNDLPTLNIILSKAVNNINPETIKALQLKWGLTKNKNAYFNKQTLIYIGFFIFSMTLLFTTKYYYLHKLNKKLKILSSTDPMTNLYNRRFFNEESNKLLNLAKRAKLASSILILDIDKFKNINDTFGHNIGDKVIILLATTLQKQLRQSDIISRWGGEEFVILLPNTNLNKAMLISEKLRKQIENLEVQAGIDEKLGFTVSIGVSEINIDTDVNIEPSFNRADKALYKAKNSGRNKVCI